MLLFFRHGQTDYNYKNKYMGMTNVSLNCHGRMQVTNSANEISKSFHIDLLVSSNLKRAIESTEIIKSELGILSPVLISNDLNERGLGILEGQTKNNKIKLNKVVGIENFESFEYRVLKFFLGLKLLSQNINILVVSHSHVFKVIQNSQGFVTGKREYLSNAEFSLITYV